MRKDVRFKAPRGLRQAIAKAAELDHTTQAEWTRRALLDSLRAKGVRQVPSAANTRALIMDQLNQKNPAKSIPITVVTWSRIWIVAIALIYVKPPLPLSVP
jgi:hypothetical protein